MDIFYEWALAAEPNCDVVLVAGDNTRLSAHKLILSGRSNVFKTCSQTELLLPEISGDALRHLHKYLYFEVLVIADVRMAQELLMVAHRLGLTKVATECETYLKDRLSTGNCLDQYEFGLKHSLGLSKVAKDYIAAQLLELEELRKHARTYDAIGQEENVAFDETSPVVQDVLQQKSMI